MRNFTRIAILFALIGSAHANADEMSEALDDVCQKVRTCALEQMQGADDMSEQMKSIVETQLNAMCDGIKAQYTGYKVGIHPLYEPATACLVSMRDLTCERLREGDETPTPQCAELKERAAAYE